MAAPDFDLAAAHQYFAAHCFNRAWDLIEKPDRSPADDRLMVALNQAAIYHWLNRPDCTDRNLSVGHWQASRIQALLGNGIDAKRQAEICLGFSGDLAPFFLGYAHESLARAALLLGDKAAAGTHLATAEAQAALVESADDRALLDGDLAGLRAELP